MNDLIGLKRAWAALPGDGSGTVDCCLLAAEVHKRLGYYDYTPDFLWVFEKYTDENLPRTFILKWLLKNARRISNPEPHAVVFLPSDERGALGTIMDDGRCLFITKTSGVVLAKLPKETGHYFRLNK